MVIKKKDIDYVAKLSMLKLTDNEKELFVKQISEVINYIKKLDNLNVKDIKPMVHALNVFNVFRSDTMSSSISRDEALYNVPDSEGNFFKVPRVIE
ncbi:MAG: Asp-tRNA(Asn)/Glu-tRNA(Gln) amidotransferase subunit GatC [Candidatus Brocadiaceae bacterium]|nr:Asp-tRNA(Asn)/Glu-tRNA(Gln) amidotransferase subunit GatC [Candidatus Brocadiaceae bacterium]